jgi:Dolichyl-phosphate-mannose-protein mannosyltransferase
LASSAQAARPLALTRAIPAWAYLTGIVVVSAMLRYALGRWMTAPWIMVDELVYSELAKSFAATGHFLIRDQAAGSYGFVYPILIAPAWRLFGSVPDAYAAAKAINAVAMSLAAVPAYFLARRVLSQWLSLAAAVLTVAVPSMVYTGTLMTENAFYPIFLTAALALVLMLERPTWQRQLAVLVIALVAFATRAQAIALFPAILIAPLLLGRRGLLRFRVLYGTVAGVALAAVVAEGLRGRSPFAVLGAYQTTSSEHYHAGEVAKWALWHLAGLDLFLGVVPFAAFLVLCLEWRRLDGPQRAFMAGTSMLWLWLWLEVSAFASIPTVQRIEERNLFYVAPFFLIALLLWIRLGAPRRRPWAATIALASGALLAAIPFVRLIGLTATSDTFALLPWWKLQEHVLTLQQVRPVATACAIAVAVLFLFVPRRYALVLPLLVLVYFAAAQRPIESRTTLASRGALFQGIRSVRPDWIDHTVGRSADVAAIWTGKPDVHVIWENEFFNRSVGPILDTGAPIPGGLPSTQVAIDPGTGLVRAAGRLVRHRYALVDSSLELNGKVVASDPGLGVSLYRLDGPLRSMTKVTGLYPNDTWSGPRVVYTRHACNGGAVAATVLGDPTLFKAPQRVTANGRIHLVPPGRQTTLTVPLRGCRAVFTVSPTRVPGNGDPRPLGIHFLGFTYLK